MLVLTRLEVYPALFQNHASDMMLIIARQCFSAAVLDLLSISPSCRGCEAGQETGQLDDVIIAEWACSGLEAPTSGGL
jgi:hypothetical protein